MRLPIYLFSLLCCWGGMQGHWGFNPPRALALPSETLATRNDFFAQAFSQRLSPGSFPDSFPVTGAIVSPLKSGDRIRITVVGFPELSGEQLIPASGLIQLPMAGTVQVIGFTTDQLSDRLTETLTPYVRRPQVSVAIVELSPLRVSVTGEVLSPGPRLLNPNEVAQQMPLTLSSVLRLSGGVTPNADLRNIVIRRSPMIARAQQNSQQNNQQNNQQNSQLATISSTGSESGADSFQEVSVNLWQAIASGELEADPLIYDGDEIIVPIAELPNQEQQALLESTVAPDAIQVQVMGEVKQPGDIRATPLTDMNGAIATAGGFTENADDADIQLLRLLPDGRVALQTFEFGDTSGPLLTGDILVVGRRRRSRIRDVFDFIGSVLNPIDTGVEILTND